MDVPLSALALAPSSSLRLEADYDAYETVVGEVVSGGYVTRYPQLVVALHPDTSPEFVAELASARRKEVRAAVCTRTDVAVPILEKLSRDKQPEVRAAVASAPATTFDCLRKLALDKDERVSEAVRLNPNATAEVKALAVLG